MSAFYEFGLQFGLGFWSAGLILYGAYGLIDWVIKYRKERKED